VAETTILKTILRFRAGRPNCSIVRDTAAQLLAYTPHSLSLILETHNQILWPTHCVNSKPLLLLPLPVFV